jgi:pyridoxine kinase
VAVITISSQLAHGHVGNSAAVFALQANGVEVAAVPTVLLSNHPRHASCRGRPLGAGLVRELLAGIEERGVIEKCKILMTGYLGTPGIAAVVMNFVRRAKEKNPSLLYLCDPVMGDGGRLYVREELAAIFREKLMPLANIVTPNVFELEQLSRRRLDTIDVILEASRALGPRLVTVTGIRNPCPGTVMTAAIERHSAWAASTPELARSAFGTGDLFAALFAARLIDGLPASTALASAVSSLYAVLEVTAPDAADIALITAAERMLRPPRRFEASALQHQKPSLTTDRDMDRQAFRIQE